MQFFRDQHIRGNVVDRYCRGSLVRNHFIVRAPNILLGIGPEEGLGARGIAAEFGFVYFVFNCGAKDTRDKCVLLASLYFVGLSDPVAATPVGVG